MDTDVVSLAFKEDTRAKGYRPYLEGSYVALSFMTLAELKRWSLERNWGEKRREALDEYLNEFMVIHSTEDLCRWWAAVMVGARQTGRRIEVADAWVAATALLYQVPLVTHNSSDYAGVEGLQIITEPEPD